MKRVLKIFCMTIAISTMISFASFAAETRKEYREEAAPIRAELQALEEQMKPLREENSSLSARYREIAAVKKETGVLNVDQSVWKEARELRRRIADINKARGESTVADLRKAAKVSAEQEDFDSAIRSLENALTEKKSRYESLKEINRLWSEIDQLLAEDQ